MMFKMESTRYFQALACLALSALSCSTGTLVGLIKPRLTATNLPTIVLPTTGPSHTPEPAVLASPSAPMPAVVFDPTVAGCPADGSGYMFCPEGSPLANLGCDQVRLPSEQLKGLSPVYPLAVCIQRGLRGSEPAPASFFYNEGCLLPQYVRYVVLGQDGAYERVESISRMQELFAPIDNENKALSYAIAITGLEARYGQVKQAGLRYFMETLQDTTVQPVEKGYEILLFDFQLCGCGPHSHYAVWVRVQQDGQVLELSREKLYEDPAEDGLCID